MSHLPRRCRKYLLDKQYDFSEVDGNGQAAVIINSWKLCEGKYDHDDVSLLLLLPNGYPDAAPDMFYVHPWIKFAGLFQLAQCSRSSSGIPGHKVAAVVEALVRLAPWNRWNGDVAPKGPPRSGEYQVRVRDLTMTAAHFEVLQGECNVGGIWEGRLPVALRCQFTG